MNLNVNCNYTFDFILGYARNFTSFYVGFFEKSSYVVSSTEEKVKKKFKIQAVDKFGAVDNQSDSSWPQLSGGTLQTGVEYIGNREERSQKEREHSQQQTNTSRIYNFCDFYEGSCMTNSSLRINESKAHHGHSYKQLRTFFLILDDDEAYLSFSCPKIDIKCNKSGKNL
ncbi:6600_t:CDS:2 [Funneliformis mosseae]|uniref:6600_t:CDS:1 n=1 Tax=Funneliformis mosseae TaxID=27381 RepID=A0A9N8WSM0_FUNMO|nr:6600_t:CDS:2 [Funneliformis mosseae]